MIDECPVAAEEARSAPMPEPVQNMIPEEKLKKFVNRHITLDEGEEIVKISQVNVFYDKYRVNVWIEKHNPHSCVPIHGIKDSWFLSYENDRITNKTRSKK